MAGAEHYAWKWILPDGVCVSQRDHELVVSGKDVRIAELEELVGVLRKTVKRGTDWWEYDGDKIREYRKDNDGRVWTLDGVIPPSPPSPRPSCLNGWKTESGMRDNARSLGVTDEPSSFKEWWESASSGDLGYVSEETARRIWVAACRRQEKSKGKSKGKGGE